MVLAINDDRKISGSMFRELTAARRLGMTLIIFNLTSNRWERYFGYQLYDDRGAEIAPGARSKLAEIRLKVWKPKTRTADEKNDEKQARAAED
ncbi:MAG TPA: hypothetical protein VJ302_10960 [Blastocatellia bacterium]|nr:hypothetical protein [Blastocatellia bacterium]